jgi:hypothetical protein
MARNGRPTYIKVNKKYLLPETLDAYNLPWEWDYKDSDFLIIKENIQHDLQEELFQHTRDLKAQKSLTYRETPRPSRPSRGNVYSRPRDDENNLLNLEVNLEDEDTFRMPTITFRNTGELLENDNDLRRRYKFRSLTRVSVVSARQHWDREDCPGVAFDYFDAVPNAPDSQFRWMYAFVRCTCQTWTLTSSQTRTDQSAELGLVPGMYPLDMDADGIAVLQTLAIYIPSTRT